VGDVVLGAGLLGYKLHEEAVSYAGGAEGVQIGLVAGLADIPRSDGSDSAAERVAGNYDGILGVYRSSSIEVVEGLGLELGQGGEEAGVHEAAKSQVARHLREDQAGGAC
jgi:hypothetical protein